MRYFVGLDVSLDSTAVCIVDEDGRTVAEAMVETEPHSIATFLKAKRFAYTRIGLEAGSLAEWLVGALSDAGLPVICIHPRHAHGVLKAQTNKTDRNDARGLAAIMRTGLYRVVRIKSAANQRCRVLLTSRRVLQSRAIGIENAIGGLLRGFGLKVRRCSGKVYEAQVLKLIGDDEDLLALLDPLLIVRRTIRAQFERIERAVRDAAMKDPRCRRLMTAPGVGPLVALAYCTVIGAPEHFSRSRAVASHLGLTPRLWQSGATAIRGRISKWGDRGLRTLLFNAAVSALHPRTRPSPLNAWGRAVVERRGWKKGVVAVARRLAVILHRMWADQADYRTGAAIA